MLKIGAKSFRDGSQDICKDTEDLSTLCNFRARIKIVVVVVVVVVVQRVIWDRLLVLRLLLAVYTCRWLLKRRNEEIKIDSRTEVAVVSNLTGKMTMDEAVKQ